ncbi:MAG: PAS domain S-box protein [Lentisphaerae bacterium]|nr:PAS domain S-box protein [Lentisphaerota bacterium]
MFPAPSETQTDQPNARPSRTVRARRTGAMLGLLLLGAAFTVVMVRREDRLMREDLLDQAFVVASAVPLDQVQTLDGRPSDENKPEYRRLKKQLQVAVEIDPDWEWIYLMGRNDQGQVFFFMDSDEFDADNPSPPGQIYHEATPPLHRVFQDRMAATEGPEQDRWGTWVSALVPVTNPQTGELITLLGIDIDAATWRARAWRAGVVPVLLTLVLLGILAASFIGRDRQDGGRPARQRWRRLEAALSLATGLALTLTAVWLARGYEHLHQNESFTALAHIKTHHIRQAFRNIRNTEIESLGRFFESSDDVTPDEFRTYAEFLNQIPEVQAWGWIPAVRAEEREDFERQARRRNDADYRLWEIRPDGTPGASSPRGVHYPVLYLDPPDRFVPGISGVGFDLASLAPLRDLFGSMVLSRLPSATDLMDFAGGGPKSNPSLFVFRPVFQQNPPHAHMGFVASVLNPDTLLQTVLGANLDRNPSIHIELLELRRGAPPERLASTHPAGGGAPPDPNELLARPWVRVRPVLAFGRVYAAVAHPSDAFVARHTSHLGWIVLIAGLSITLAGTGVISVLSHRREDMELRVDQRAFELASAMRRYDQLARRSRTYTWETDARGLFTDVNDVVTEVLGYAPADLIGRRHFFDLHPEEGRDTFRQLTFNRLAPPAGAQNLDSPVVNRSGEILWITTTALPILDDSGRITGYQGMSTDITESKKTKDELTRLARQNQDAVERYRALISASNTGAWEYNDQTARLWASPEYFAMLGRDAADFEGDAGGPNVESAWLDLIHPDEREHARQLFAHYLRHPVGMYEQTFRMRHADGRWIWVLSRGRRLHNADGSPTPVVVGTHIDITERKRAEQDYRTLFHEMLEGFAVCEIILDDDRNPLDYRFLAVNPAFERITGLPAAGLIGNTAREALPEITPDSIDTYGRVALTGEPAFFRSYSTAFDKHFEVTAFRPAPGQFACIVTDITDRVRAENELRESRRQYAALLANLPGMAYRCRNDRSWTMEFVSDGCRDLTGYAPEDIVGNRTIAFNDIIVPRHRERVWTKWQQALADRRQVEDEFEITTRSGETKWVWEQGEGVYDDENQLVALEGFITDITDRKHAGMERDRLTTAIEQSRDTIVITDAGGTILYVNNAFTRITGYSRDEAVGQNPRILQSGRQDREFYAGMWQRLGAGLPWEGQIVNKRKDGSLFTELASISPVRDADGRIVHYVAVKRDISQQIRDQEEKETLQAQLLQSQKMESIGRLAGGIAHDFNNMLQAILGYTEMGLEQVPPDQPLHGDLQEIQKAARRSAALTRQLQAFARKQPVTPKVIDLNMAIANMSRMLRPLIGESIEWVWNPGDRIGSIKIDPGQLDQLVTNLCINARDAILQSGGRITVETRDVQVDRVIHGLHGDIPPGAYVRLSVADNGHGMSPDVLEHIFEPFFTTKQSGKGTGLGLATVYGIVRQNLAAIRVISKENQGATFQIYFPRQDESAAEPREAGEETDLSALRGTESILIVEDEVALLQTATRMLKSLGYEVLPTLSPEEALCIAGDASRRIDLLLTDVMMPEMNGPDLVQSFLKLRPLIRYVYMSGYTANLIGDRDIRDDSPRFVQKPFSRHTLARKIRAVLDA